MDSIEVDLGKFFFTDPTDADAMYEAMTICLPPYLARWSVSDVMMDLLSGNTKKYKTGELHIIPAGKAFLWNPLYIVPVYEALYSHQYGTLVAPYTWNLYPCTETQNLYLQQHIIDERTKKEVMRSLPIPKPRAQRKTGIIKLADYKRKEPAQEPTK